MDDEEKRENSVVGNVSDNNEDIQIDAKLVGQRIKRVQEYLDKKNLEMADELGITVDHYRNVKGGRRNLTLAVMLQMMKHLHVNPNFIYFGNEEGSMFLDQSVVSAIFEDGNEKNLKCWLEKFESMPIDDQLTFLKNTKISLADLVMELFDSAIY